MTLPLSNPKFQIFDNDGLPLVDGKVYSYDALTSSAKNTYSDYLRTVPNANPVVLNARGEADIFLGSGMTKLVVKDSNDVTIWTIDALGTGETSAIGIDVRDFGAIGDGIADDSAAIQAAIDYVDAITPELWGYPKPYIWFPAGEYRVETCIDATMKTNVMLKGVGGWVAPGYGTTIVGDTGDNHAIIDISGSAIRLHGLSFIVGLDNPSSIGLLGGYVTNAGVRLSAEDVYIYMTSDPTANNGLGTIGLANRSMENCSYHNFGCEADAAMVITTVDDLSWLTAGSPHTCVLASDYVTWDAMSAGVNSFSGNCQFIALGCNRPAVSVQGANALDLGNSYFGYTGVVGAVSVGLFIHTCNGLEWHGHCENLNGLMAIPGLLTGAKINGYFTPAAGTDPIIDLSTDGSIYSSDITVIMPNGSTARRYIYSSDGSPTSQIYGTDFKVSGLGAGDTLSIEPDANLMPCCNGSTMEIAGVRRYLPGWTAWTPVVAGATSAGTGTYTSQIGRYLKVGNQVHVQGSIVWSAHTGTGDMTITGLPAALATANVVGLYPVGSIWTYALTLGKAVPVIVMGFNTTTISVMERTFSDANSQPTQMANAAGQIYFSLTYMTDY